MGSMRRDRPHVTNQPAPDARPSSLHQRLTVALANAADRARLAEVHRRRSGRHRRRRVLAPAALRGPLAGGRRVRPGAGRGAATRCGPASTPSPPAPCTTATPPGTSSSTCNGWQRTLVEGAEWATQLHDGLPEHLAAVEAVRGTPSTSAGPSSGPRQQDLERVLEQRIGRGRRHRGGRPRAGRAGRLGHGRERRCAASSRPPGRRCRNAEATHAAALGASSRSCRSRPPGSRCAAKPPRPAPVPDGRRRRRPSGHRGRARRPGRRSRP